MNASGAGAFYIGVMSGTSLDGIDSVLIEFYNKSARIHDKHYLPIPKELRREATSLITDDRDSLNRASRLGNLLTDCYAESILAICNRNPDLRIEAVGCHGQTLRHFPTDPISPFTLQIVNGARLAIRTGLQTVTDFRSGDMALGGQGAPLAPAFHATVFRSAECNRVVLNLGGIANISYLPASLSEPVIGFDTGPANTLMDHWAKRHLGREYDENGAWARLGTVSKSLLLQLLADPYFALGPPKSTGREYFGEAWLNHRLQSHVNLPKEDIQATLTELTAQTIVNAIGSNCPNTRQVFMCGGGSRNTHLTERIQDLLKSTTLATTETLGIVPELVEASAFAWLAQRRVENLPGNIPGATGASRETILGALYAP